MSGLTKARRCELLAAVLAMAEERDGVELAAAAAELGVEESALREVLDPLLYLEYRPADTADGVVSFAYAFELDEGVLRVEQEHWLRDLDARAPRPESALRLFVAGTLLAAELGTEPRGLDSAMEKLEAVVGVPVVVHAAPPPHLRAVRDAQRRGRVAQVRYFAADDVEARDRQLEIHRVFQRWGRWYFSARDVGSDELKTFRVDRVVRIELTGTRFAPRDDVEVPEWFDLDGGRVRVVVEVGDDDLALLRNAYQVEAVAAAHEAGRHVVTAHVPPGPAFDYLLLRLRPDADVREPADAPRRRQDAAAAVLARYED